MFPETNPIPPSGPFPVLTPPSECETCQRILHILNLPVSMLWLGTKKLKRIEMEGMEIEIQLACLRR